MKIQILILALLFSLSLEAFESKDYSFNHIGKDTRYSLMRGLRENRWANSTINWYYNPANQPFTTEEVLKEINLAISAWEATGRIDFVYMGETDKTLITPQDDKFVIGWLDSDTFVNLLGNYAGYTYTWWDGINIVDSEMFLNVGAWSATSISELSGLITHEFGHSLGIQHSDKFESIMYAKPYHPYEYQKTLRDDDFSALTFMYPEVKFTKSDNNSTLSEITIEDNNLSDGLITKSVIDSKSSGWNLLGSGKKVSDYSIFNGVKSVWSYKNGVWNQYSPSSENITDTSVNIDEYDGFWILK